MGVSWLAWGWRRPRSWRAWKPSAAISGDTRLPVMFSLIPLLEASASLDALHAGLRAYVATSGFPLPEDERLLDHIRASVQYGHMDAVLVVAAGQAIGAAAWRVDGLAGTINLLYLLPEAPPAAAAALLEYVMAALRSNLLPDGIYAELPALQPMIREALHAAGFGEVARLILALDLGGHDWPVALPLGYGLRAWRPADLRPAARVIYQANLGTLDAMIIPELRTLASTRRIVQDTLYGRYGGFDRAASGVVLAGSHVVGVTLVTRRHRGEGFTAEICVLPAHQRRGLGRALLHHTHAALCAGGVGTATLGVTDGNPARLLYERVGYRQAGAIWTYVWPRPDGWPESA
ncbi:MAG: GNAT family N-acetyltransferase [Anaerolineae bacterium]|nr:GNAT family N-acetyltransferase [Anaerolineae bacterium]